MRFLIPVAAIFVYAGVASATTQLNVAFGASVPADPSGQTLIEKSGPTRISGGEHFTVRLSSPKMITDIKITDYSTSHLGKALIHTAVGTSSTMAVPLNGLSVFADAAATGSPQNYQNLVMLGDTNYVEVTPNQVFSVLDIVVEGFTNDDASMLLQITTSDSLPAQDYLITRTGPDSAQTLGSYVNEANYAKFAASDLQELVAVAAQPAATDLAGKTFTCSSYSKLNPAQINFKTRTYALSPAGVLVSTSTSEGANLTWTVTADGMEMPVQNYNGCGNYTTNNVVRMTAAGNLISEVVLNLNNYLALCTAAGYDAAATQAVETNSTYPSLINSQDVVDSYEFCH